MLLYKYQYLENLVNDEHVPNDRSRVSYICEKEKYVFDGGVSFIKLGDFAKEVDLIKVEEENSRHLNFDNLAISDTCCSVKMPLI